MTNQLPKDTTMPESQPAVVASVEPPVRPRAWAIFVDNGNARMWSTLQPHVHKLADAEGLEVTRLYDQAAIDAAVAAELERCIATLRDLKDDSGVNDDGQAWLRRLTRGDCVAALVALGPNAQLTGPL